MKRGKQPSTPSLERVQEMRILTAYRYLKDAAMEETAIRTKWALFQIAQKEAQLQYSNSFRQFLMAEKCNNSYFKASNIDVRIRSSCMESVRVYGSVKA